MYFNDQQIWATDSELLDNDAILLGQPVDAVVTLPHPTKQDMIIILEESLATTDNISGLSGRLDGPADGAADSIGGEASCHAARLIHGGQVDLGGGENVTKISVAKKQANFK